jgi:hypothetical protein
MTLNKELQSQGVTFTGLRGKIYAMYKGVALAEISIELLQRDTWAEFLEGAKIALSYYDENQEKCDFLIDHLDSYLPVLEIIDADMLNDIIEYDSVYGYTWDWFSSMYPMKNHAPKMTWEEYQELAKAEGMSARETSQAYGFHIYGNNQEKAQEEKARDTIYNYLDHMMILRDANWSGEINNWSERMGYTDPVYVYLE